MNRGLRPNASHVFFHYKTGQTAEFALGMGAIRQGFNTGKEALKNRAGQAVDAVGNAVGAVGQKIGQAGSGVIRQGNQLATSSPAGSIKGAIGNKIGAAGQAINQGANAVINNRNDIGLAAGGAALLGAGGLTAAQIAKKKRDEQMGMQPGM